MYRGVIFNILTSVLAKKIKITLLCSQQWLRSSMPVHLFFHTQEKKKMKKSLASVSLYCLPLILLFIFLNPLHHGGAAGMRFAVVQWSSGTCWVLPEWRYSSFWSSPASWDEQKYCGFTCHPSKAAPSFPCQLTRTRCCLLISWTVPCLFRQGPLEMAQPNPCSGQGHLQQVAQRCVHRGLNVSKDGDAPPCLGLTPRLSVIRALRKPGWCPPQIFRFFLLLASPRRAGSRGSSVLAGIWLFGGGYGSYQAIWRRLPDWVWKTMAVLIEV